MTIDISGMIGSAEADAAKAISCLEMHIAESHDHRVVARLLAAKAVVLRDYCGAPSRALEVAKEAHLANPDDPWIIAQLAMTFVDNKDFVSALPLLLKMRASDKDYNYYTILARCQLESDPIGAKESAEAALALNPSWEEAAAILKCATDIVASKTEGEGDGA